MEFAAALVGPLAKVVLPEVVSAFKDKMKKPLPCKEDVERLGDELRLTIASIKDHDQSFQGKKSSHVEEELVKQLRKLAHKIEDCTESFLRQVMSDDGREKKDTSVKFGDDIRGLLISTRDWNQRLTNATRTSGASPLAGAPDSPAETSLNVPPVGMDEALKQLKKLAAEANVESQRKLKVISIVGFGGLGKTLLARQVFNYSGDDNKFDLRVWIRADDRTAHQLLEEILEKVGENTPTASNSSIVVAPAAEVVNGSTRNLFDWFRPKVVAVAKDEHKNKAVQKGKDTSSDVSISEVDRLTQRLKSALQDKRYLIVIIDMRDKEQWCRIGSAFSGTSLIDSRIIVTTTKLPVAKACSDGGGYVYKMSSLTGDYPRQLFLHPSNLEKLDESSERVVKKCDGLPLALICLSENCRGELENMERRSKEAILKICGPQAPNRSMNPTGNTPSERLRRMLLSSYQDLPNSFVKVSLLYFCMFPPDDDNVRRNSVIRRLMAEGLGEAGSGEVVNDFEALIDHCVAQSTEVSNNGKTKRCKVPGIMLEYITRMTEDQCFATVCDESQRGQPPSNARRLSLHPSSQWKLPEEPEPKVRTLAVFGKKDEATTLSNKEVIAKCEMLRVLDLEGCGGLDRSDIRNFCRKLLLLKYLSLGASINEIPKSIKKLQVLETLDLRKTKIDMVPVEVIMLPQLKHLLGRIQLDGHGIFRWKDILTEDKTVKKKHVKFFSSDDSKLEMLSGFVTGSSQGFPQLLSHMANLRKVKIWCDSNASERNLEDLSRGILKFLRLTKGDNGRSLSIHITNCPETLSVNFLKSLMGTNPSVNTYPPLPPTNPPSLYSFKLHGNLSRFPDFLTHLNGIKELCLSGTDLSAAEMQDGLNRLPESTLKYLKLVEKKLGTLKLSKEKFTGLVRICLVAKEITGKITISDEAQPSDAALPSNAALPFLVSLHVLCEGLDGLSGIDIRSFPMLKEVGLHSRVNEKVKDNWETAAKSHPNWPNLVLIDPPKPKGS